MGPCPENCGAIFGAPRGFIGWRKDGTGEDAICGPKFGPPYPLPRPPLGMNPRLRLAMPAALISLCVDCDDSRLRCCGCVLGVAGPCGGRICLDRVSMGCAYIRKRRLHPRCCRSGHLLCCQNSARCPGLADQRGASRRLQEAEGWVMEKPQAM